MLAKLSCALARTRAIPLAAATRYEEAVSQENVELARARFEVGGVNPNWYDPDVRWHLRADLPDSEKLVGRDRLMQFCSEWTEAFREPLLDVEELIGVGDYVVATRVRCPP